jgi:hypothetical protein
MRTYFSGDAQGSHSVAPLCLAAGHPARVINELTQAGTPAERLAALGAG